MKIIGITGKSGAGKTEIANYLESKESVGVIHVDRLMDNVKRKYFKIALTKQEENKSKEQGARVKFGIREKLYSNKFTFNFLMKARSIILKRELLNRIEQLKKERKEIVVIDDWLVGTHKYLRDKLNKIYVVKRPFLDRRKALREREGITNEETRVWDIPFATGIYKEPVGNNVVTITNDGTLEDLYCKAEKIYDKYHKKTFDERYKRDISRKKNRNDLEDFEKTSKNLKKVVDKSH